MVKATSVFLLVLLLLSAEEAKATTGRVVVAQGSATLSRGDRVSELKPGDRLEEGDTVAAAAASFVRVVMVDGSILDLGENTRVVIRRYSTGRRSRQVSLKLFVGRLWARVVHIVGGDDNYEVSSTNAVVGVRGTQFVMDAADDGRTEVTVLSGHVTLGSLLLGGEVDIHDGERSGVNPDGKLAIVRSLTPAEIEQLRKQGQPLPALDKGKRKKRLDKVRERLQIEVTPGSDLLFDQGGEEPEEEVLDAVDRVEEETGDHMNLDPDAFGGSTTTRVRGDVEVIAP